ncbi:MAG: hypothetical protein MZU97_24210 [Bacillus subtilis]|nr:hypothetical protein [Bacillus subtilis]
MTREEQDAFALSKSDSRRLPAVDAGVFDGEIVPIEIKTKKETLVFARDEYPNRTTNADKDGQTSSRLQNRRIRHRRQCLGHQRRRVASSFSRAKKRFKNTI